MSSDAMPKDPWHALRRFTSARIGLGRVGHALPCRAVLDLRLAHAQARDAVHRPLDWEKVERALCSSGLRVERLSSQAANRAEYLQRPDLGRCLDDPSRRRLAALASGVGPEGSDVLFVVGDGLSTSGVEQSAAALVVLAARELGTVGVRVFPTVLLAAQARVALADPVGELLGARTTVMVIGERPGLSSPDSVGLYVTHSPRPGRQNAERNCISNVRLDGLAPPLAAARLVGLLREALRRGLSGVELKEPPAGTLSASTARHALRSRDLEG